MRAISKRPGLYAWEQRRPMSPFAERTERLAFGLPVARPVSITDAAGSPVRVLARADDEPLDHGTDVYATKVEGSPKYPAQDFGR